MTVHHISEQLDIEEHWTEEPTPQLKSVEIVESHGDVGMATTILPDDLEKVIETLQVIHSDKDTQRTIKLRKQRQ